MNEFFYKTIAYQSFVVPPLCYVWAWWSWIQTEKAAVPRWRRAISEISLGLLSAGIGLGAFSISYLYAHPEHGGLPDATIWSMEAGAIFGILALVTSTFSKSWTRIALVLSSADLLFFLYLIALSP